VKGESGDFVTGVTRVGELGKVLMEMKLTMTGEVEFMMNLRVEKIVCSPRVRFDMQSEGNVRTSGSAFNEGGKNCGVE
jgi:hypothetical protein